MSLVGEEIIRLCYSTPPFTLQHVIGDAYDFDPAREG